MFAVLSVNGEQPESMLEEDGRVSVDFDWESNRVQWRCRECDAVFADEDDADGEVCDHAECLVHIGDENCDDHDCEFGGHDLVEEAEPLSWVNSAAIDFDEASDKVTVSISVGDPRGAFVMSIYRTEEGLRMGVPRPNDLFLHMPLREINDGFYAVGSDIGEGK
jgi:hypothetical protein